ncbi:hypothetical protein [Mycobacterium sp. ENV421]|uniref:hypothetical protein n=1 Tax=Mycobacterium sp. ENV421 TaxID=1213407 RepID=UPI001157D04A|nr:hypothetical protein [Mycobacterium sp. ENV421]
MSSNPRSAPHGQILPPRKEFWERWSTRVAVVTLLISAVIVVALVTDPSSEPWYSKTFEVIQDLIARAHPGGVTS